MGYSYQYSYELPVENSISDSGFAIILSIYLIILAAIFIFWIVSYIFWGIGLYTMAKREGRQYPWLAFIPFARNYLHGELAEVIPLKTKAIRSPGIWKLVLPIISGVIFTGLYILLIAVVGVGTILGTGFGYTSGISGGTMFAVVVIGGIWIIAAIAYEAVYKVLCVMIDFQIFGRFTSRNMAIVHGVLSVTVPLYEAICFFVMRNKKYNPGMEPVITPPPVPPFIPYGPGQPGQMKSGQQMPENGSVSQGQSVDNTEHSE